MAKYRLDTMLESETLDKLIELAKKEKRSKSAMASILIEDGLIMAEQTKPVYDNMIMGNKLHENFIREASNETKA